MGAVAAMLAAAPSSPLAQPRNVFFGHLIAGVIALLLDYLCNPKFDLNYIPPWVAAPLCPGFSMGLQAKLGILHPPSCSACVIYTMGLPHIKNIGWYYLACPLLLDSVILILIACIFNNLSEDRSYPLYW
mmetsp:Transcript_20448/g.29997  ORF Transcript_20448/g.29997 Transcript_20448/m.29997 type:complete len:130 (+) Transcript_20448:567-956(+)